MARLMLSDELWSKLQEIMLQHGIYDKTNLRMMVEAILYRMRVGCPWRDLPVEFGFWNSIYQQFNRWSAKNKFMKIFQDLVQDPEVHESYVEAARREKRFKNWCRQWKLNLIEELNPEWRDLYEDICC